MGLRRDVKDGKISVKEAIEWCDKNDVPKDADIRKWLRRKLKQS